MYNHQLDTFLTVARTLSFSSASEELYVSPSAVNQQITSLEEHLKVSLFIRSRQGLKLTPAGEYLQKHVESFIDHAHRLEGQLQELAGGRTGQITVALPHMHNIRLLYNIWGSYVLTNPGGQIHLVSSNSWNVEDVFRTYSSCDLVEYVDIRARWMTDRAFLNMGPVPVSVAVPKQNSLSVYDRLCPEQLRGQTVATAVGAFSSAISRGIERLEAGGASIQWEKSYQSDLMDRCCLENKLILVLHSDYAVHPGFRIVPLDWDVTLPYGFSYKNPPSPEVEAFLNFAAQWREEHKK